MPLLPPFGNLKSETLKNAFKAIGEKLRAVLNQALRDSGVSGTCTGVYANPVLSLAMSLKALTDAKLSTLFIQEMAKQGIHCLMSFKATLAHSDDDIAQTGEAAARALKVVKEGLENDCLDDLLEVNLKKEPFRRLVR